MHHRKNRSQGGDWSLANIVHLCGDGVRGCHGWVTSHPLLAREQGFALKSWENPAEVPILLYQRFWTGFEPDSPTYTDYVASEIDLSDW